ncbi:MAG: macrolide transport system ATP-binding/permease protein [Clostridiales bacterium]|nr:macrolide transport system ATP-binding/permease protein [Clostridiales bacterium]
MIKRYKKQFGILLLVAAGLFCMIRYQSIGSHLVSEQAASRFGNDGERYAQISAFFTEDATVTQNSLNGYRSGIRKSLEEASIQAANQDARLWMDCYSSKRTETVTSEGSSQKVNMIGVGGDFFYFHPLTMLQGYYFAPNEESKDRILIDQQVAWDLFGSDDVVGKSIEIGGKKCRIAGVFLLEEDKVTKQSVGKLSQIMVPFELFAGEDVGSTKIGCYQMLLPNPVSGFAKQLALKNVAGVDLSKTTLADANLEDLEVEIIENSNRFEVPSLLRVMKEFQVRTMKRKALEYPFWENIARAKENEKTAMLGLVVLIWLYPLLVGISWLWKRFRNRKWTIRYFYKIMQEKQEVRKRKKWEEKRNEKKEIH